ncbi:hypothetical protein [Pelomonas sp. KK5]|uniref:hypothetical protein n=1 Tax=Pelomonas sp. KK5 TaxID=1855730 RepID=UPI00097C9D07|nr:hypothetical protein [Pelomonas sp. KK5]
MTKLIAAAAAAAAVLLLAGPAAQARGGGGGGHSSGGHSSHASNPGGSHATKGYTKKDGTYVAPSHATNPNKTKRDNWSSKGNVNPHTGKEGTKGPDNGK